MPCSTAMGGGPRSEVPPPYASTLGELRKFRLDDAFQHRFAEEELDQFCCFIDRREAIVRAAPAKREVEVFELFDEPTQSGGRWPREFDPRSQRFDDDDQSARFCDALDLGPNSREAFTPLALSTLEHVSEGPSFDDEIGASVGSANAIMRTVLEHRVLNVRPGRELSRNGEHAHRSIKRLDPSDMGCDDACQSAGPGAEFDDLPSRLELQFIHQQAFEVVLVVFAFDEPIVASAFVLVDLGEVLSQRRAYIRPVRITSPVTLRTCTSRPKN